MANINVTLTNPEGDNLYPTTNTSSVFNSNNESLDTVLVKKVEYVEANSTTQGVNQFSNYYTKPQVDGFALNFNPIINGDFKINQRDNSTYTTTGTKTYTVDKWWFSGNSGVNLSYDVATKTLSNTGTAQGFFAQTIEDTDLMWNKTWTMSAKVNGTVYSKTYTFPSKPAAGQGIGTSFTIISGKLNARLYYYGTGYVAYTFDVYAGCSAVIEWVKLELGSIATDFVPRLYQEELLLCRRYCFPVYSNAQFYLARSATEVRTSIQIDMRAIPNATAVNPLRAFQVNTSTTATSTQSAARVSFLEKGPNSVILGFGNLSGLTQGGVVFGANTTPCIIAILDADL